MVGEGAAGTAAVAREVVVPAAVYTLDTVKRAAYRFIDRVTVDFAVREDNIVCSLTFSRGLSDASADALVQEFKTELLDQDLRQKIGQETAPLRNAILALAFAATTKSPERE